MDFQVNSYEEHSDCTIVVDMLERIEESSMSSIIAVQ